MQRLGRYNKFDSDSNDNFQQDLHGRGENFEWN